MSLNPHADGELSFSQESAQVSQPVIHMELVHIRRTLAPEPLELLAQQALLAEVPEQGRVRGPLVPLERQESVVDNSMEFCKRSIHNKAAVQILK